MAKLSVAITGSEGRVETVEFSEVDGLNMDFYLEWTSDHAEEIAQSANTQRLNKATRGLGELFEVYSYDDHEAGVVKGERKRPYLSGYDGSTYRILPATVIQALELTS